MTRGHTRYVRTRGEGIETRRSDKTIYGKIATPIIVRGGGRGESKNDISNETTYNICHIYFFTKKTEKNFFNVNFNKDF